MTQAITHTHDSFLALKGKGKSIISDEEFEILREKIAREYLKMK